jgi:hypothetical protein
MLCSGKDAGRRVMPGVRFLLSSENEPSTAHHKENDLGHSRECAKSFCVPILCRLRGLIPGVMLPSDMSFRIKQVATHTLPLTILTFCLITLKVSLQCFDGPDETRFGFPLGWSKPSLVSSLEYIIDVPALAIDFSVYLGVWFWLSRAGLFRKVFAWSPRLLSICLWLMAGVVAGFYLLYLSQFGHAGGVSFGASEDCTEVVSYRLHLGPL